MAPSGIAIMLARQRSGTNALRYVLSTHPDVFTTPEVFHAEPNPAVELEASMNFFGFLAEHGKGTALRSQSAEVQEEIFLDYLDFIRGFSDRPVVLVDVKLNAAHHFDGPWRSVTEAPAMFGLLRKHGIPVLHLTRQNYLRYYLSWQKAEEAQRWGRHDRGTTDEVSDPKVVVDVHDMLYRMRRAHAEETVTAEALWREEGWLSIDYDELFPRLGAPVAADALERVAAWLGVADAFGSRAPASVKLSRSGLRDTIENYDDVAAALEPTRFAYCLEDERAYRA